MIAAHTHADFAGSYRIQNASLVLTPALAIYEDLVSRNIATTLELLGGRADRWRPHVKTAKLLRVMQMLVSRGITTFKCATTLELRTACDAGASDVLFAFPAVGATAQRLVEIAHEFPQVRISVLVDSEAQLAWWAEPSLGAFLDINSGMNRTGVSPEKPEQVLRLARHLADARGQFRGLHYYDGHLTDVDVRVRTSQAHAGYDQLLRLIAYLERNHIPVAEVITSGTPALPCALSYSGFAKAGFVHQISPGTVVYGDATSQAQLSGLGGYGCAALILSRVVSHPAEGIITCDAGHKSVSADPGVPNCVVLGRPGLRPLRSTEEHLPIALSGESSRPPIGELLYLLPKHVCPTVNNFSEALWIRNQEIVGVEGVTARGHECRLNQPSSCPSS